MNNRLSQLLPLLLTFCLASTALWSQSDDHCIEFEGLSANAVIGAESGLSPGEVFYSENEVDISLQPFVYSNGNDSGFYNIRVWDQEDGWQLGSGRYLFVSNVNLSLDFSGLPETVTEVCFEFIDGGGDKNIAVNGEVILSIGQMLGTATLPVDIAPGVTASIDLEPNTSLVPRGTICLKGDIQSLIIGGQEFALDNICFKTEPEPAPCELRDLEISSLSCNEDSTYNATLNFRHQGTSGGFVLETAGGFREEYEYSQLPLVLTGLPISGEPNSTATEDLIVICDKEKGNCCVRIPVDIPCIPNCEIGELKIETRCNDDGTFNAWLDFEYEGVSEFFLLKVNGRSFDRRFRYDELPLKFENLNVSDFTDDSDGIRFKVCDVERPNCCRTGYAYFDCSTEPVCEIGEPRIEISCNEDGTFDAWIDFDHANTGDKFTLKIIGAGFYRQFSYDDLPLKLEGLEVHSTSNYPSDQLEFRICDIDNPNCCVRKKVDFYCPGSCAISMLRVAATECDEEGRYNVRLNFSHTRREGTFVLEIDGDMRGVYRYKDLPLELGSFKGPLEEKQLFVVYDKEDPECRSRTVLMPFDCNPPRCDIRKVLVYDITCHVDGTYDATVDLHHRGTGDRFLLETAGGFRGEFAYEDLPVRLEGLPAPTEGNRLRGNDVFEICDTESEGCCVRRTVHVPCVNLCQFLNLRAEASECEDDQFFINLSFEARETDSRGYFVFAGGRIHGPYTYQETDIQLGPFDADSDRPYNILLVDADNFICFNFTRVAPPSCEEEPTCRIEEVRLRSEGCNPDGSHSFTMDLDAENPGNDFYEVFYQGERLGTFPLDNLPSRFNLMLGEAPPSEVRLQVCINDQPDCCLEVTVQLPECEEDELRVWPGDANRDNVANHLDLLNIGIAFGAQGPDRSDESTEWEGFLAPDWELAFADGTNYKNADTNGDGAVNADDTLAILLNYGRTHGEIREVGPLPNTVFDPPLFIDLPEEGDLPGGVPFEIPIILGTAENPVKNIYGIAFRLEYDAELITDAAIVFPTTWFGAPGINSISLDKSFGEDGVIEAALSRTDQNLVSGYGPVAYFRGIIDDIAGLHQTRTSIEQAMARSIDDQWIPLRGLEQDIKITPPNANPGKIDLERGLRLFPNPTPDQIRIFSKHGVPVEWVEILDPQGRHLGSRMYEQQEISLQHLPEGVYLLRMKMGKYVITKRVVKM